MQEVRRLRKEKGWTQTELAFYSSLAPSVISQIETGKRNPSAGTLTKLAEALGVEVRDLFPLEQPRLPESLAFEDVLAQAGVATRWVALPDGEWDTRLDEASEEEALQIYEEVQAERLASIHLRHHLWQEGSPA